MVTFDARADGTASATWEADPRWARRPAFDWGDATELLVLVAHADDETLGAGGLLAAAAARGMPTRVVVATDGTASTAGPDADRDAELDAALGDLAPGSTVARLRFPDAETDRHRGELRAALAAEIQRTPRTALLAATWRGDGHRDHRIVGELAAELADGRRLLEFPIWLWHWADPDDARVPWTAMRSLPVDPELLTRAIGRHVSQISGPDPQLRPGFLAHFARTDQTFLENPRAALDTHFDAKHAARADPWGVLTRSYEARKRALTLAALPRERYTQVLEIGSSIGALTADLVSRADRVVAMDLSAVALDHARTAVPDGVAWVLGDARDGLPLGSFDLVVLSEVGYYWSAADLRGVVDSIANRLATNGEVVACHWRAPIPDGPLTGDMVHAEIAERLGRPLARYEEDAFLLEVFRP